MKTTIFSEAELNELERWSADLPGAVDIHRFSTLFSSYAELGYYKHLNHASRWRLRKAIEQTIASAIKLGTPKLESFGRCVVLRSAQWALDGRSKQTSVDEFRLLLARTSNQMLAGARDLRAAVAAKKVPAQKSR